MKTIFFSSAFFMYFSLQAMIPDSSSLPMVKLISNPASSTDNSLFIPYTAAENILLFKNAQEDGVLKVEHGIIPFIIPTCSYNTAHILATCLVSADVDKNSLA